MVGWRMLLSVDAFVSSETWVLVEAMKCQDIICWKHQVMKAAINQQQLPRHERL